MAEPLKLLLIEDDEDDYIITRDLISDIPNREYLLEWADDYEKGRQFLRERRHDIYLVDYRLGAHSGLELLNLSR